MILRNTVLLIVILFGAFTARAQEDTSFNTSITLQEVVVQHDARLRNSREKKHGTDLQTSSDQLLESIAGINMIKRGNYAWEPTIRGLNAGQVNVTISGMAVFGACTDRMDPASSYIEPNNLQSITVS
ncbi:MAG TPA: TonB-dependent receptor plug domain-containing protein, partial [Agriterribacter sp.]|nr:TonB-dependent receptor plug domain-containing protein [Agriterribacter sp.]